MVSLSFVLLWLVCIIFFICLKGWKILMSLLGGMLIFVLFIENCSSVWFEFFFDGLLREMVSVILFLLVNFMVFEIRFNNIWCRWVGFVCINFGIFVFEIMLRFSFLFLVFKCINEWMFVKNVFKFIFLMLSLSFFVIICDMFSKLLSRFNRCLLLEWIIDNFCWKGLFFVLFISSLV